MSVWQFSLGKLIELLELSSLIVANLLGLYSIKSIKFIGFINVHLLFKENIDFIYKRKKYSYWWKIFILSNVLLLE